MKSNNRDDGWLTRRLYFNREDKRIMIKRPQSGLGYTMNLGNKWTWIFNIIFVIIIIILVSVLKKNFWFEELSGECKSVILCKKMHCILNLKQWVHFSEKGEIFQI